METNAPLEMTIVLTSQLRTSAAHIDLFSIQQLGVCWSFHVRQGSTITEVVYILHRGLKMDKQQLNYDFCFGATSLDSHYKLITGDRF